MFLLIWQLGGVQSNVLDDPFLHDEERRGTMFRAIVFIVALAVFAKPAYEYVSDYLEQPTPEIVETVVQNEQIVTQQNVPIAAPAKAEVKIASDIDSLEKLTDAFYVYFSQYATSFTIQYKGNTADIDYLINKAVEDALARDSYVAGHLSAREINYEYTKFAATINVKQTYLTNLQQEQVVDAKIASLVAGLDVATMSDFQKVKFVNDYIVKNTQYSEETATSAHSAYTLVQEGKAVCQGYALFATKLLRALGVEAMYVTGEVYSGGHAWNLVKVDGDWFHLDTTWNDPVPDRGSGVRYNYFLVSDQVLRADHVWQTANYPAADSERYQFMQTVQDSYEKDGYIYYSNSSDDNKLYRLHMQTGETKLVADTRALYIVGLDEWLYFSNYSNGAYLSKIRVDGSEESVLVREKVSNLFVEGGYLYFTANGVQQKIKL